MDDPVRRYYAHYFPADDVHAFATLHARDPSDVEVAVTFEAASGQEIWKRFNACARASDLRALACGKAKPTLHVGAAYSEAASRARVPGVRAVGKPLLFDLDVQDWPFLRVDKANVEGNDRAVRLLFGAAHVLQVCLEEMFGFEHFLPVYSGRRGLHLWVLDERAWHLGTEARKAICAALTAPGDGTPDDLGKFDRLMEWPSVSDACEAARRRVEDEVLLAPRSAGAVGMFDSFADTQHFLNRLFTMPDADKQPAAVREAFQRLRSEIEGRVRWIKKGRELLDTIHEALRSKVKKPHDMASRLLARLQRILFTLTWPRLDEGASASLEHCAKVPFSLKAETGRISLPLTHLLPDPRDPRALPPLVTCAQLAADNPAAHATFDAARATLRATLRAARGGAPVPPAKRAAAADMEDIEELVPRCASPLKAARLDDGGEAEAMVMG
jgi:DNA primase small subunit